MDKQYRMISVLILGFTILLGIACLMTLPNEIAVHWNAYGEVNGYMPTYTAVTISIFSALLCLWIWHIIRAKYEVWFAWKRSLRIVSDCILGGLSCLGLIVNIVFLLMN